MGESIRVYAAREIVTMNPSNPSGRYVAVRDGLILGVAHDPAEFDYWGKYEIDDRFAGDVLVPGFVEAHAHSLEGLFAETPYVGYFDRLRPDGSTSPGSATLDDVVDRLQSVDAAMTDPEETLVAWGLDPIYYPGERANKTHLDRVSSTRSIFLLHASGHVATVNSALLRAQGITAETETEGVVMGEDGEPTGELQEAAAMMHAGPVVASLFTKMTAESTWWNFGRAALVGGVTTMTDLGSNLLSDPALLTTIESVVNDDRFPARVVSYAFPAALGASYQADDVVVAMQSLKSRETSKWRLGGIKLVADGSIQGWTAVLNPPGYSDGSRGIWTVTPAEMNASVPVFHAAGINVHCHCNGDAIVDAFTDAVELALRRVAWLDHRHTVQHCQLATSAQLRRMANLGMAANLFANHLWYWGDQHYEQTVGPERANRLEPAATAQREGVRFALHSDANVTPLGGLHLIWAAVNRVTPKGRVLGPEERISAYDALKAVTVDAAYQLHMDREIGSIEIGKRADFAVLSDSPLEVDPMAIRDIAVRGTMVGGVVHEAPRVA